MLFHLRRPSASALEDFLGAQERLELSHVPRASDAIDHQRTRLGEGEALFERARAAIQRWVMLRLGWVEPIRAERALELGATVGVLVRLGPVWIINACRIVELNDEPSRFGFAYATLPGHIERGIERFTVERSDSESGVFYDLWARSAPGHVLTRLGYPFARRMQRRFQRDSARMMQEVLHAR